MREELEFHGSSGDEPEESGSEQPSGPAEHADSPSPEPTPSSTPPVSPSPAQGMMVCAAIWMEHRLRSCAIMPCDGSYASTRRPRFA